MNKTVTRMFRILITLAIALTLSLLSLNGQQNIKVEKSEFKTEEEGFRDAWKSIKEGDDFFDAGVGMYPEAVISYLIADEYNSNNAELNYKIGLSYLFGAEPLKSLNYFLEAYRLKPDVTEDILLLTGRSYQWRGDYGKAIDCYNMYSDKYHDSDLFNPEVNNLINQCNMAIEMAGREKNAEIVNPGMNVNSEHDDYSPVLTQEGDILYFTTRRNIDDGRKREDADMKWDENIYFSVREKIGWNPAVPAGNFLCTELNEGILAMAANGRLMFIYAGYAGNGDILISELEQGMWSEPVQPKERVNSNNRESSISVTEDQNEIFFTSDKSKGIGGRDIYYVKRVRRNKWTKPENMGDKINSPDNEESVYVSPGGDTIWFSSNRPGGMGGYDIYMSVRSDTGAWSEPLNIGMPANSQSNDLFYKPSLYKADEAWFASDRPGGYGGFDIYKINFLEAGPEEKALPDTMQLKTDSLKHNPDTLFIPHINTMEHLHDRLNEQQR